MVKFKKFVHIVFEKYGVAKLFGSTIIALLFFWLFNISGIVVFKWVSIIFGIFIAIFAILLFTYAWIINPIKAYKKEKSE